MNSSVFWGRFQQFASGLAIVASCLVWASCASASRSPDTASGSRATAPTLAPGDAIRVQVWREADISGTFSVDDRGIVTLPLIGERQIAGLEPTDLRDRLLADYREYLQNPSVEVTVLRRISILGEVRSPGLYPVDATVSLSDALAMAGGVAPNGDKNDIQLIRGQQVIRQDLNAAMYVGTADIRSGDQIVVGEKGWLARNPGAFLGSLIAAGAIIASAIIR